MARKAVKYRLLDEGLFRRDPTFFKRAIAYRLIHMFTPKPLTKRLPKGLQRPLIGVGSIVPPGFPTFPGLIVPPGTEIPYDWAPWLLFMIDQAKDLDTIFPPGWRPGDPLPEGIDINTAIIFPPDWTPGDQLPDGVTVDPGSAFPPGWTPGDLLPDGIHYNPETVMPPGWTPDNPPPGPWIPGYDPSITPTPDGPAPPSNLDPSQPGPPHRPPQPPPAGTVTSAVSGGHDGYVVEGDVFWNLCRDAEVGIMASNNPASASPWSMAWYTGDAFTVSRGFIIFDLSGYDAGWTLTACRVTLAGTGGAGVNVCVLEGTQADPLTTADYNNFSGSSFSNLTWAIGDNEFVLDAAGIAYVNSCFGGNCKLCIREYTHDYLNSPPGSGEQFNSLGHFTNSGTEAQKPEIELTYKA